MNRDDIIHMARETDRECNCDRDMYEWLEWFAQLVAAAERKVMSEQVWRQCAKDQRTTQFCGMVEQAVQAEREACADVCEANADDGTEGEWDSACNNCAYHIRARGQA